MRAGSVWSNILAIFWQYFANTLAILWQYFCWTYASRQTAGLGAVARHQTVLSPCGLTCTNGQPSPQLHIVLRAGLLLGGGSGTTRIVITIIPHFGHVDAPPGGAHVPSLCSKHNLEALQATLSVCFVQQPVLWLPSVVAVLKPAVVLVHGLGGPNNCKAKRAQPPTTSGYKYEASMQAQTTLGCCKKLKQAI